MANVIGIDFGTTKTLVSWVNSKDGKTELVRLGHGTDKIPTSLYIESNGTFFFGEDADDRMEFDATRYQRAFKLSLGVKKPCIIVKVKGVSKSFTARELTTEFLKYIKKRCEEEVFMGGKISSATITAPVSFSPAQKEDLLQAAQNAGFIKMSILLEPEAAGIAFAKNNPSDKFKTMMIVDWGGGTLDLAMISNKEEKIKAVPKSFDGDGEMGGEVFDEQLLNYLAEVIEKEDSQHRDILDEPMETRNSIYKKIRDYKERLSKTSEIKVVLPGSTGAYSAQVSQQDFTQLIKEYIDKASSKLSALLTKIQKSGNGKPEALLMIGGSSAIPAIRESLSKVSGLKCVQWHHSHEAVALGAGIHAGMNASIMPTSYGGKSTTPEKPLVPAYKMPTLLELSQINKHPFNALVEAAKKGIADAQFMLACLYLNGDVVSVDNTQAMQWFKKSAEQSNVYGTFGYAQCLYLGLGIMQDVNQANSMFKKIKPELFAMAEEGDAIAQFLCGKMYAGGYLVDKNIDIASQWFLKSAQQNYPYAMSSYAEYCIIRLDSPEDFENIDKYSYKAIENGCTSAHLHLLRYYEDLEIDLKTYEDTLKQAIKTGHYQALLSMGKLLVQKNKKQAREYFQKARQAIVKDANNNNAMAQYWLGMLNKNGYDCEPNPTEAFKWFNKAAQQDHVDALSELTKCYLTGYGTFRDCNKGLSIIKDCLEKRHKDEAEYALGELYFLAGVNLDSDSDSYSQLAITCLSRAADLGDTDAMTELGFYYLNGTGDCQDINRGVNYLSRAAELGDTDAMTELGRCYLNGTGIQKDITLGVKHLSYATKLGNTDAMAELERCFLNGTGVQKDFNKAIEYLSDAAEDDNAEAHRLLGVAYTYGSNCGIKEDLQKGKAHYTRAAELGNVQAEIDLFNLGFCYSEEEQNLAKEMTNVVNFYAQKSSSFYQHGAIPQEILSKAYYGSSIKNYDCILGLYDARSSWGETLNTLKAIFTPSISTSNSWFIVTYNSIVAHNSSGNIKFDSGFVNYFIASQWGYNLSGNIKFDWDDITSVTPGNGNIVFVNGKSIDVKEQDKQSMCELILKLQNLYVEYFIKKIAK